MNVQEIAQKVVDGIDEVASGHGISDLNEVKKFLMDCGMQVRETNDTERTILWIDSPNGHASTTLTGVTWEESLRSLKNDRMGFCLVVPDGDYETPEYRYMSDDKVVTTYDKDGSPKTKRPWYAVVKSQHQVPWGVAYWFDTPENRARSTVNGLSVSYALARVFAGKTGSAMGRGFAFSENVQLIRSVAKEK